MVEEKLVAKYPFLSQSKDRLGGSVSELDTDLKEAEHFARECFNHAKDKEPGYYYRPLDSLNASREAKNLLLSRLMLYFLGATFLRKFASLKACEYRFSLEVEPDSVMLDVARDFFPSLEKTRGGFKVDLVEYLEYGHDLPQVQVSEGKVFFLENEASDKSRKSDLRECLEHAIELRIADSSKLDARVPDDLKKAALRLREIIPREFVQRSFSGKLLQRPELQNVLKGVSEGKRYYGAMAVAIACVKDGLAKEEALEVMQSYVENCAGAGGGSHPFTPGEGNSVVEWVYRHPTIGFSFQVMKNQGLIE